MLDGVIPLAMLKGVQQEVESFGSGFTVKGVVATVSDLPVSGELGDLYMVSGEGYASYVWDNQLSEWERKDDNVATSEELLAALFA